MLEQVRHTIRNHDLLPTPGHLLVAVSGGADSMAMLYALFWLRRDLDFTLTVAHLDHGIRADSLEDAALVRAACRDLDLPLAEERVDVPAMRGSKGNLEEVARHARHDFLERTARRAGAQRIALGHTRTDVAETLLLHLLRGAGPAGLRGLTPCRPPYIRPLVDCSRGQTRRFCRAHHIRFRDDPTNEDLQLRRNAVRAELLPKLREFNPKAEEALARAAYLWAEAYDALSWAAREALEKVRGDEGLAVDALRELPPAVQRLLLRQAAADASGGGGRPTKAHVDALWSLVHKGRGEAHLPRGLRAWVQGRRLMLGPAGPAERCSHPVPVEGEACPPGLGWLFRTRIVRPPVDPASAGKWVAYLDLGTLEPPLEVRSPLPGDRFRPLGMGVPVRVRKLMSKSGVPRHLRDGWPVLCHRRGVVWVVGVRLSEDHKVTARSTRVLRVEAVREE